MNTKTVRVADTSTAELQRGLEGVTASGMTSNGEVLVQLTPNTDGLYGGEYWFPVGELERKDGDQWVPFT